MCSKNEMLIYRFPAGNCLIKYLLFYALNLMKWNISVIKRKEIKKYFGSTGEGTWNRPASIFKLF